MWLILSDRIIFSRSAPLCIEKEMVAHWGIFFLQIIIWLLTITGGQVYPLFCVSMIARTAAIMWKHEKPVSVIWCQHMIHFSKVFRGALHIINIRSCLCMHVSWDASPVDLCWGDASIDARSYPSSHPLELSLTSSLISYPLMGTVDMCNLVIYANFAPAFTSLS